MIADLMEISPRLDGATALYPVGGVCFCFTPAMMATQAGEVLYDAMPITVSAHRVGNRPGRQEPRLKKRRAGWRKMMTKPRNAYHRRLNAEASSLRKSIFCNGTGNKSVTALPFGQSRFALANRMLFRLLPRNLASVLDVLS